ncbi:N-acetylmuramoyl-L-alanine amidase, partial [Clostridia bacterium OttesenSCG-928-F22]|nr:N-acetylmuramoyl-L-alanine amidase [Clostridia bacterium OttesenSCG-928-F22]
YSCASLLSRQPRTEDKAIASYKRADMEKRRSIISNSGADIVLSIHQNSNTNRSHFGPMVYYAKGSEKGERMATILQTAMNKGLGSDVVRSARIGDFWILNSGSMPCVLIECGFISNPNEEYLLRSSEHHEKLADMILMCTIEYFYNMQE